MPTSAQILTLTQWLSPAYPVGAFAYSHGLEWAVEAGDVYDADTLENWLTDVLHHGGGQSDARFLVAAYHAKNTGDLAQINTMCRAFAPSKERLMEADLQGAAFCDITGAVWAKQLAGLAYPVAVGRAANLGNLPLPITSAMFVQAFVSNLVAAAMRLIPLGQTKGQALIHKMVPSISTVSDTALSGTLNDLSGTAFLADIAAMRHETQYSRIFRT